MKVTIKFTGSDMLSKGIQYTNGGIYTVSEEVANYLEKNFKCIEVISKEKLVEVKEEIKDKPKVGAKVVPAK